MYYVDTSTTLLCEVYFRFHHNQIMHQRIIFDLAEWMGNVGGVPEILNILLSFLIGNYIAFYSSIVKVSRLY